MELRRDSPARLSALEEVPKVRVGGIRAGQRGRVVRRSRIARPDVVEEHVVVRVGIDIACCAAAGVDQKSGRTARRHKH